MARHKLNKAELALKWSFELAGALASRELTASEMGDSYVVVLAPWVGFVEPDDVARELARHHEERTTTSDLIERLKICGRWDIDSHLRAAGVNHAGERLR